MVRQQEHSRKYPWQQHCDKVGMDGYAKPQIVRGLKNPAESIAAGR
jgi:hypothetical protein